MRAAGAEPTLAATPPAADSGATVRGTPRKGGALTAVAPARLAHAVPSVESTFAAESDLAAPVRTWLAALPGVVGVGEEIDAGSGIADLVAGLAEDLALPTRPLFPDPFAVHVMEASRDTIAEEELRRWAPNGWRSLRQRVLEPLLADGQLRATQHEGVNDTLYTAAIYVGDPFSSLVAVELKLRDWRRAVAQAGRYRLFAERSYVAMPVARMTPGLQAEARRNRVGVLAVHTNGDVDEVEPAPVGGPLQPSRRRWASEQLLGALRHPSVRPAGSPIL